MPDINTGDTAWVLVSAALVLFMTPGLALFYGGMVRAKNVLAMLMQNFFALGIVDGDLGGLRLLARVRRRGERRLDRQLRLRRLKDMGSEVRAPIPALVFVAFQLTFAVITPALITGSIADRMRWPRGSASSASGRSSCTRRSRTGCSPVAGWPSAGALDFAGGTVVHVNAGSRRARAGHRARRTARAGRGTRCRRTRCR